MLRAMSLFCPNCGISLEDSAISWSRGVGRCVRCRKEFDVNSRLPGSTAHSAAAAAILHPRPVEVKVQELGGRDWQISWRWFNLGHIGMLFFCVAWDSFLVFWYGKAFTDAHTPWLMILFPIGHLAVGVGLTYATLAGFLNSTRIEHRGGQLSVRSGPLPWRGNQRLDASEIVQVYAERNDSRARSGEVVTGHTLCAVTRDGARVKLLSSISTETHAQYLQSEIARRLGLSNRV
jgi:hypothetical protein